MVDGKRVRMITVAYDLVSENLVCLKRCEGSNPTREDIFVERRKNQAKSWLRTQRIGFWADICEYGRTVNSSVFVVPERNFSAVEGIRERYVGEYEIFFKEYADVVKGVRQPHIVLLEFHPSEEDYLRGRVRDALLNDLAKLQVEISKIQTKQNTCKGPGISESRKSKLQHVLDQVLNLKEAFEIESTDVDEHIILLEAKIRTLKLKACERPTLA